MNKKEFEVQKALGVLTEYHIAFFGPRDGFIQNVSVIDNNVERAIQKAFLYDKHKKEYLRKIKAHQSMCRVSIHVPKTGKNSTGRFWLAFVLNQKGHLLGKRRPKWMRERIEGILRNVL